MTDEKSQICQMENSQLTKPMKCALIATWKYHNYIIFVQVSALTLCACAASIKMIPTPHIGSTTQKPGWETEDNIQYSVFDNKHYP